MKRETFEVTAEVGEYDILNEEEIEKIKKKKKMEERNHEENTSQKEHR